MWLHHVKQESSEQFTINWKPFSLAQVNQRVGDGYLVWEEPEENLPSGIWGLRAGFAAQQQGGEPFDKFFISLLLARHVERSDLGDKALLSDLAVKAGLDLARFQKDLNSEDSLREIAESHTEAVEIYGIFGTPTFRFSDGSTVFLKMINPENSDDAVGSFNSLMELMTKGLFVGEMKRPQPPWPRGVFSTK